jgi:hypothetical protein
MADKDNNMYRSSDDKFLAGVCSGLAHKLGFSKWVFVLHLLLVLGFMESQFLPTLSVE